MPINFNCKMDLDDKIVCWNGLIYDIHNYGNHYELKIESRSNLTVIIGCTSSGNFACIPDFNVGCHLSNLRDKFWNMERLSQIIGDVDGTTIAFALHAAADYINLST
jgi:hypothetical protein